MERLADEPTGSWMSDGSASSVAARVRGVVRAAGGKTPVVVVYDVPGRDCGRYSAGGTADRTRYAAWVSGVAVGLGQAPAVVVLEPDAVAQTLPQGGCPRLSAATAAAPRYTELAAAVATLTGDRAAHVYLDAGNVGFIQSIAELAGGLRSAGIGQAAGFALNVSSFYTTADSTAYGLALSKQLGGAHFIIDTSRNGNGPYVSGAGDHEPVWCNPPAESRERHRRRPPALTTWTPTSG